MSKKIKGFELRAITDKAATLFIYDVVGFDGTDAKTVVKALVDLQVETINVRINSPGGLVFDGFAIYNALAQHKANIIVTIDGLAASIASVIAMAGDEVIMASNATMMIHNPWVFMGGNAEDLRKQADVLDQLKDTIADIYVARTGLKKDAIVAMMADETWMNSTDTVAKKFADRTGEPLKAAACAPLDISTYKFLKAPKDSAFQVFPVPSDEEKSASPDHKTSLRRKRLALAEL